MSGDLEDFLRRAAQRRQAKAAQEQSGQQARPARRPRPEYSNRKTERIVTPAHDEVLTAEVVAEESVVQKRRQQAARQAAAQAKAASARAGSAAESSSGVAFSDQPVQDLLKLLRQPGGVRQAILLREILDRPEHRW